MTRCKGKTRIGDQCRNNAIAGNNYCYIGTHGGTKASFAKRTWNFVCNHWGTTAVLFLAIVPLILYFQDKYIGATTGILHSSNTANRNIIAVGSTRFIVDSPDGIFLRENNDPLISLHMKNNKLYVSARLRDRTGDLVAELKNNEWQLNKNSIFDRNYTDQALEVRERSGKVILQVANMGEVIHFAGIFHCKNGWTYGLIPVGEMGAIMDIRPPGVELVTDINPIFAYPSEKHFGESPGFGSLKQLVGIGTAGYRLGGSLEICK